MKVCLIAEEKQNDSVKRFELMETFVQSEVHMNPIEKISNPTNQTTTLAKNSRGSISLDPIKFL